MWEVWIRSLGRRSDGGIRGYYGCTGRKRSTAAETRVVHRRVAVVVPGHARVRRERVHTKIAGSAHRACTERGNAGRIARYRVRRHVKAACIGVAGIARRYHHHAIGRRRADRNRVPRDRRIERVSGTPRIGRGLADGGEVDAGVIGSDGDGIGFDLQPTAGVLVEIGSHR